MNAGPLLYVIGAGGHAREIHAYLLDLQRNGSAGALKGITLKGFLDDGLAAGKHGPLQVLGPLEPGAFTAPAAYLTAMGDNAVRRRIVTRIEQMSVPDLTPWTLIHPTAWIGENIQIGEGACIAPSVVITAGVRIGRHSILNLKASVSHDCTVGDFVNINPGATICGWVSIGDGAFIGAGAVVKDRVSIGAGTIIGAGAVVTADIPAGVTAVGVPARIIKTHAPQ